MREKGLLVTLDASIWLKGGNGAASESSESKSLIATSLIGPDQGGGDLLENTGHGTATTSKGDGRQRKQ